MRFRELAAVFAVTVTAASCGTSTSSGAPHAATSSSATAPTGPTGSPQTADDVRGSWKRAVKGLVAAGTGQYTWSVRVDGLASPLASETGAFGFEPERSSFERTYTYPSSNGTKDYTVRLRRGPGISYLQMDEWTGDSAGCWMSMGDDAIAGAIADAGGGDLGPTSNLPVAIDALISADVTGDASDGTSRTATRAADIDGLAGLQLLAIGTSQLAPLAPKAAEVSVPVTVGFDADGGVHGLEVDGGEVLAALRAADVSLDADLSHLVESASAEVAITSTGGPAVVKAPPADLVVRNAESEPSCPAHG
jgi:hypothetical protein